MSGVLIPAELRRSIPRPVRRSAAGQAAVVAAVVLFAAATTIGSWLFVRADRARSMASAAADVRGEIVALRATRGDRPRWIATYTYVAGDRIYSGEGRLGRRDRQRVAVGDPVDVRYLPSEPERSWVAGHQPNRQPIALAPIIFVSLSVPAIALLLAVRRQARLLESGRPAVAVVAGSKKIPHSHGSSTNRVRLEFRTLSGASVLAHIDMQKRPPAVGAEILVLYDPETPTRCARYPLALVRSDDPMIR